MKTQFLQVSLFFLLLTALAGCKKNKDTPAAPADDYGTISVQVDGTPWNGLYCSGSVDASSSDVKVIMNGLPHVKSTPGEDMITLSLNSYTGKGEYKITGKAFGAVKMLLKGTEYVYDLGTGTEPVIRVTETTPHESVIKPGKIIGEFSGTLTNKKSGRSITLTNGKFTCRRVL